MGLIGVDQDRALADLPDDILAGGMAVEQQGVPTAVKLRIYIAKGDPICQMAGTVGITIMGLSAWTNIWIFPGG
jgi:hypothetical protein